MHDKSIKSNKNKLVCKTFLKNNSDSDLPALPTTQKSPPLPPPPKGWKPPGSFGTQATYNGRKDSLVTTFQHRHTMMQPFRIALWTGGNRTWGLGVGLRGHDLTYAPVIEPQVKRFTYIDFAVTRETFSKWNPSPKFSPVWKTTAPWQMSGSRSSSSHLCSWPQHFLGIAQLSRHFGLP